MINLINCSCQAIAEDGGGHVAGLTLLCRLWDPAAEDWSEVHYNMLMTAIAIIIIIITNFNIIAECTSTPGEQQLLRDFPQRRTLRTQGHRVIAWHRPSPRRGEFRAMVMVMMMMMMTTMMKRKMMMMMMKRKFWLVVRTRSWCEWSILLPVTSCTT